MAVDMPVAAVVLAAAWAGALAGVAVPYPTWWLILTALAVVVVIVAVRGCGRGGNGRGNTWLSLAAVVLMGSVSALGGAVRAQAVSHGPVATAVGATVQGATGERRLAVDVTATVASDVVESSFGQRWALARLSAASWAGGDAARTRERVVLRLPEATSVTFGAHYRIRAVATPLGRGPSAGYYRRLGAVIGLDTVALIRTGDPPWWQQAATAVRARLAAAAHSRLPSAQASLLTGLVTGDLDGQPPQVADQVRAAGLSHLVAVSGSNVALVVAGTMGVALRAGWGRRQGWWLSLVTVWWFVVMVRADPSVVRAAVMASLVLGAMLIGRIRSTVHVLATAGTLALLADPMLAGRLGFVLSVAATAGVLFVTPLVDNRLAVHVRLPRGLRTVLAATCGAQLAVAPVLLSTGGAVHPASLPANLVAVPIAAAVSVIGAALALVATVTVPVAGFLAGLTAPLLTVILTTARWFAQPAGRRLAEVVIAGLVICVVLRSRSGSGAPARRVSRLSMLRLSMLRLSMLRLSILALSALVVGVALVPFPRWPGQNSLPPAPVMRVLDVGQGDAVLLGDPDAGWLLIDAGPQPDQVAGVLAASGIDGLSAAVVTHADADHVAGLPAVLRTTAVGMVLIGPKGAEARDVVETAAATGTSVREVAAGASWRHGSMRIRVLSPPASGLGEDRNENSLVLRADVDGGRSVLLAGDAEEMAQTRLLDEPLVDADVLKVPHHGGNTNAEGFVAAVSPAVAVISAGRGNDFGHPHPDVLADLAGVTVRRTDVDGTVEVPLAPS